MEDYIHRIGRTGRAGATGIAYTFFCDKDSKYASDLVKVLEGADQRVPSQLRDMVQRGGYGTKFRRWESSTTDQDNSYGCTGGESYSGSGGRDIAGQYCDRSDNAPSGGNLGGGSFHERYVGVH